MERGTDREYDAVRSRWEELEKRRQEATRLLRGLVVAGGGIVLLLLSQGTEACVYRPGGWPFRCESVGGQVTTVLLAGLGVLATGVGLWVCWTAVRSE